MTCNIKLPLTFEASSTGTVTCRRCIIGQTARTYSSGVTETSQPVDSEDCCSILVMSCFEGFVGRPSAAWSLGLRTPTAKARSFCVLCPLFPNSCGNRPAWFLSFWVLGTVSFGPVVGLFSTLRLCLHMCELVSAQEILLLMPGILFTNAPPFHFSAVWMELLPWILSRITSALRGSQALPQHPFPSP